ncbi:MAG: Fe-S protein assembly co-chaperone HscB [Proteobacteria bacterium]|jgi:molecular chaperone HscB|nr:Fe-S protein assembly co-chaperone HscB [Pseudomonadota bacterium]NCA28323.1 Fe-S protein assembly co-chaperone HscB [Pseudomonadota bacterium]
MKNYFEVFNLPINFDIDLAQLEKNYLQLQQQHHPDTSNIDSIENSILINHAYKILSNDLLRAIHMLQISGIDIENDENHIKPKLSTLNEVLDLQEKIHQISELDQILSLKNQLKNDVQSLILNFCQSYEKNDLNHATQVLIKAKYLTKSMQDLKLKEKSSN